MERACRPVAVLDTGRNRIEDAHVLGYNLRRGRRNGSYRRSRHHSHVIRVITELVPAPSILVLCDNAHCGVFASQEVPSPNPTAMQSFIAARALEGWSIGIDLQICPAHVNAAKQQQRLIHVPSVLAH